MLILWQTGFADGFTFTSSPTKNVDASLSRISVTENPYTQRTFTSFIRERPSRRYSTPDSDAAATIPTTTPAEQRLETAKQKRLVRQSNLDADQRRNLELKALLEQKQSGEQNLSDESLFAVKVSVCPILRRELNLNGREKRGRMFLKNAASDGLGASPPDPGATSTLGGLRMELHSFFRCLKKSTYLLSAC